jgi:hypothetical protein
MGFAVQMGVKFEQYVRFGRGNDKRKLIQKDSINAWHLMVKASVRQLPEFQY